METAPRPRHPTRQPVEARRPLSPPQFGSKGNPLALNSSPHGAGREYSRSRARKTFTQDDLRTAMGDIEYRDTAAFVDEIPAAYKDIDIVMKDAADLVEVRHVLRQIINVKGD